MKLNIPDTAARRIVIIGAGFGGLNLAKELKGSNFQVILLDKNNYHQFQPLLYQVAMSGLEPSSIIFPLRKIFQNGSNIHLRIAEVINIDLKNNSIETDIGSLTYDVLVIASGACTNFFNNKNFLHHSFQLKSLNDSIKLRNSILADFEEALLEHDSDRRKGLLNIVIVGGGPTGVELAGALAEMKEYIFSKDYPELDKNEVNIYLFEASARILGSMSENASSKALKYLTDLNISVILNDAINSYDGKIATTQSGKKISAKKLIWVAGVKGNLINGVSDFISKKQNRYLVDEYHKLKGTKNVYAIGDISLMTLPMSPNGHPQVAQVAIQQGKNLANNLINCDQKKFKYKDFGSMAIVGRNRAVCDIGKFRFSGFLAWLLWTFIHIVSLIGFKNKMLVLLNWIQSYLTKDQALRVIIGLEKSDKNEKSNLNKKLNIELQSTE